METYVSHCLGGEDKREIKMKRYLVGLALACSMLATTANARDGSAYFTLEGGITSFGDIGIDVNQTSNAMDLTTNAGWEYGAIIGYDFGSFRLEAEATRKTSEMQQLRGNSSFDTDEVTAGVQALASVRGNIEADAIMVNALLDIGGNDGVGAYGGVGIGYAGVRTDGSIDGVIAPFVDDSDNGLAWQLVAGVAASITESVELGARYRYFNVGGIDMTSPGGRNLKGTYSSHSLMATLTFNFGGN
jgi:OmpA-OmpF porin, OOP family